MVDSVDQYLAQCRKALWGLTPGRRARILRILRADLLDEAEVEAGRAGGELLPPAFLARRDPPQALARALRAEVYRGYLHNVLMALIPALTVFCWTVLAHAQVPHPSGTADLGWVAPEAAASMGIVLLQILARHLWQRLGEGPRLLCGSVLGLSLGLLFHQLAFHGFMLVDGLPFAYLGFALERMARRQSWQVALLDALGFALLLFALKWGYRFRPEPQMKAFQGHAMPATRIRPTIEFPRIKMYIGLGVQMLLWAALRIVDSLRRTRALQTP